MKKKLLPRQADVALCKWSDSLNDKDKKFSSMCFDVMNDEYHGIPNPHPTFFVQEGTENEVRLKMETVFYCLRKLIPAYIVDRIEQWYWDTDYEEKIYQKIMTKNEWKKYVEMVKDYDADPDILVRCYNASEEGDFIKNCDKLLKAKKHLYNPKSK